MQAARRHAAPPAEALAESPPARIERVRAAGSGFGRSSSSPRRVPARSAPADCANRRAKRSQDFRRRGAGAFWLA